MDNSKSEGSLAKGIDAEQKVTAPARSRAWSFEAFLLRYTSAHTRRAYSRDWHRFCEECQEWFGVCLSDATARDLGVLSEDLVLAWLRNSEKRDSDQTQAERAGRIETRRRMLASLAAYSRFLVRKGVFEQNPLGFLPKVPAARAAHQRSSALSPEEMRHVLAEVEKARFSAVAPSADGTGESRLRLQDSFHLMEVVVWTLLTVGMRVSELTGLRLCDFVQENEHYRLRMSLKGGQDHDPLIHPITAEKIRKYIIQYRHNATAYAPLFVRAQRIRSERPLSQYGVFKIVSRAMEIAGIDKKISPHGLRATLATALVKQRVPLVHIKDLLGHRSIHTTGIYVKRATEKSDAATLKLDIQQYFGYVPGQELPAPDASSPEDEAEPSFQEDSHSCNIRLT
jgi:site-specific recombinase XerD